eukprot:gene11978-12121_t
MGPQPGLDTVTTSSSSRGQQAIPTAMKLPTQEVEPPAHQVTDTFTLAAASDGRAAKRQAGSSSGGSCGQDVQDQLPPGQLQLWQSLSSEPQAAANITAPLGTVSQQSSSSGAPGGGGTVMLVEHAAKGAKAAKLADGSSPRSHRDQQEAAPMTAMQLDQEGEANPVTALPEVGSPFAAASSTGCPGSVPQSAAATFPTVLQQTTPVLDPVFNLTVQPLAGMQPGPPRQVPLLPGLPDGRFKDETRHQQRLGGMADRCNALFGGAIKGQFQIEHHKKVICLLCNSTVVPYEAYHIDAIRKHFVRHHEAWLQENGVDVDLWRKSCRYKDPLQHQQRLSDMAARCAALFNGTMTQHWIIKNHKSITCQLCNHNITPYAAYHPDCLRKHFVRKHQVQTQLG